MSRSLSRVAGGALGILVAAAAGDVAIARAQTSSTTVISTTCGTGTIEKCGDKPLQMCDTEYVLEFDLLTRSFKMVAKQSNCKVIGSTPIYKNRFSTTCSSTTGGGSTGTGLVGIRGSGDEQPSGEESCE